MFSTARCLAHTAALATCLSTAAAIAQIGPTPVAPTPATSANTIYRLNASSSAFEAGPLIVPAAPSNEVRGVFNLQRAGTEVTDGRTYTLYAVREFNTLVTINGQETWWSGSGTYRVENVGMLAVMPKHRLTLALRRDHGAAIQFESGLLTAQVNLPAVDISVTGVLSGGGTVQARILNLRLAAGTVNTRELQPFTLDPRRSTEQQGCINSPCLCPVALVGPTQGSFSLVPLRPTTVNPTPAPTPAPSTATTEYAVVRWDVFSVSASNAGARSGYSGAGIFRRQFLPTMGPTPVYRQRMQLDVLPKSTSASAITARERWDSTWVLTTPTTPRPPAVALLVKYDPANCFSKQINFVAKPALAGLTPAAWPNGGG